MKAFKPLVKHKRGRGLRTHIATVEAIVRGDYGDHRTGARDLQEVIRRFLQAYTYSRGVEWVLIGGDVKVVPIRFVCGSCSHGVFKAAAADAAGPKIDEVGHYAWMNTFLALRLADNVATDAGQIGQPDHILTMLRSGKRISRVDAPVGNELCWFYTDSTWTKASTTPTPYVRVNGPAEIINDEPQWYTPDNLIPSDLYYASLFGPNDLTPGKHDWDLLDQGLYGQWSWNKNLGGIDYTADISIGRAPVSSVGEVTAFVSKVIAYETADSRPAERDRFTRMLFVAEHWDHHAFPVLRNSSDKMPPDPWSYTYSYDASKGRSLIRAEDLKEGSFPQLLAYLPGNIRRAIPYDHEESPRGWYYAKSATDLSPSTVCEPLVFGGYLETGIPLRTEFVVVRSNDPAELTPESYFFDPNPLDGSISDMEKLRNYMGGNPRLNHIECLYSDEEDLNAAPAMHLTPARVEDALQAGPHFVAVAGHGNWWGCCGLNPELVPRLRNGSRTSIFFVDSCLTAEVDAKDCLAARGESRRFPSPGFRLEVRGSLP